MFTLKIKTRDYIKFAISSNNVVDLITATSIFQSGLQARQDVSICVSRDDRPAIAVSLPCVTGLTDVVETLLKHC